MHAATGHVILAHLPPELRTRAIDIWKHQTENSVPKDLDEHLEKIKTQGYEERDSYEIRGVINISYPVLDERGNAVAALTVPYLARMEDSTTPKTVRTILRDASLKLSEAIGGVPHPSIQTEKKTTKKPTIRS
jgi:DNA-binding IclR family transcriptional regulator